MHKSRSLLAVGVVAFGCGGRPAATTRTVADYGKLPIRFEANLGQADPEVRFLARGTGYELFVTGREAVLALPRAGRPTVVRMRMEGGNPRPAIQGVDQLPTRSNYFIGDDPARWHTGVPNFASVRLGQVYPGVDLVYYGNQGRLEYDFVVAPGADPGQIRMVFAGADDRRLASNGDLILGTPAGELRLMAAQLYQRRDGGAREEVPGRYVLEGQNQVAFAVGAYDTTRPLVIDPVLSYATFLGGTLTDEGASIAVDLDGNAYVTGVTTSTNFPGAGGLVPGNQNAFVTKINAAGTAVIYSTYLGGPLNDKGTAIKADFGGSAYVTGFTQGSFPSLGALQVYGGGASDAFVAKLTPTGGLVYATYLGGTGEDAGLGIAVDLIGSTYVTGTTRSATRFPLRNAQQASLRGTSDAFVTLLSPSGTAYYPGPPALFYSTYLGGYSDDAGMDIAVTLEDGLAYVTGRTQSTDFPVTSGCYQAMHGGGWTDAFVTRFDGAGVVTSSTFIGGSADDEGRSIALDGAGSVYLTGPTLSSNLATTAGAVQSGYGGGNRDAFVARLNGGLTAAAYITYLGGSGWDEGYGIAVDNGGNAHVGGFTESTTFRQVNPVQAGYGGGTRDAFIATLNPTGTALVHASFLGGSLFDSMGTVFTAGSVGHSVAVDGRGSAYITGHTLSANFPTTPGVLQPAFGAGVQSNGFVVKLAPDFDLSLSQTGPATIDYGKAGTYTLLVRNLAPVRATGVVVEDSLPATTSYVSATTTSGSCTRTGATVRCTIGDLAAGATATVTITAQFNAIGWVTNTARVTGTEPEANIANNVASTSTRVYPVILWP